MFPKTSSKVSTWIGIPKHLLHVRRITVTTSMDFDFEKLQKKFWRKRCRTLSLYLQKSTFTTDLYCRYKIFFQKYTKLILTTDLWEQDSIK